MQYVEWKQAIAAGRLAPAMREALAVENPASQTARYEKLFDDFAAAYGETGALSLFSVGGRSEISGNHTDHNHGRVIAAAVNLDILAVARPREDGVIRLTSAGFPQDVVSPEMTASPDPAAFYTSRALIAGMERAFLDAGYRVGGFDACTTSNVRKGSGISSSAAFEVMVGNILNHLYNDGAISPVEIAKMAQFSENVFFGKPCGLMDQTACAVGGFITIDFADPENPAVEKIPYDLSAAGFSLCIVHTGGNHANLNDDYASVPAEMHAVANALGVAFLRDTSAEALYAALPALRRTCGDRAILRAFHFFAENERVSAQAAALRAGDTDAFLNHVWASGASSFRYLQNVYTVQNPAEQGLSLALCLTEAFLRGKKGACRVHGGGFAGTIQAFIPDEDVAAYRAYMEKVFGVDSVHVLRVRPAGAYRFTL